MITNHASTPLRSVGEAVLHLYIYIYTYICLFFSFFLKTDGWGRWTLLMTRQICFKNCWNGWRIPQAVDAIHSNCLEWSLQPAEANRRGLGSARVLVRWRYSTKCNLGDNIWCLAGLLLLLFFFFFFFFFFLLLFCFVRVLVVFFFFELLICLNYIWLF